MIIIGENFFEGLQALFGTATVWLALFGWHGRYRKGVNNWKIKRFDPCRV